jgi:hypothetical protein
LVFPSGNAMAVVRVLSRCHRSGARDRRLVAHPLQIKIGFRDFA